MGDGTVNRLLTFEMFSYWLLDTKAPVLVKMLAEFLGIFENNGLACLSAISIFQIVAVREEHREPHRHTERRLN
jgi:hypothetical protein